MPLKLWPHPRRLEKPVKRRNRSKRKGLSRRQGAMFRRKVRKFPGGSLQNGFRPVRRGDTKILHG